MNCGMELTRITVCIVNAVFFVCSALLLAFGITGRANPGLMAKVFWYIIPAQDQQSLQDIGVDIEQIIMGCSSFMIVVGVIGIVVCVVGFVGACWMIHWLLILYCVVQTILFLFGICLIIFAAVESDDVKRGFARKMQHSLLNQFRRGLVYFNESAFMLPSSRYELAWAYIQTKYKCCGAYTYNDIAQSSIWDRNVHSKIVVNATVPISCCSMNQQVYKLSDIIPRFYAGLEGCLSGRDTKMINTQTCFWAMYDAVTQFSNIFKIIAIVLAAFYCAMQLFLIVGAFVLALSTSKVDGY